MGKDLATRVQQNNQVQQNGDTPPLSHTIRDMEQQFAVAAPKGVEATRIVRDALTLLRKTPKLAECESMSVLGGLMTCAQLGLRPGILGHAWLLPFYNGRNRRYEAQLVIGYQGYVDLAHRSGRIETLTARTVYTNDHFRMEYGAGQDIFEHRPALDGPRGEPRLFYSIARTTSGGYQLTDPMTVAEMEAHRDRFAMARDKQRNVVGPWKDHFVEMAQKTMLLKNVKYLPKSADLAVAIETDSTVRLDIDPTSDPIYVSELPEDVDQLDGDEAPAGVDAATGENTNQPGPDGVPPVPDK